MISIFASIEKISTVQQCINGEHRLNELVSVTTDATCTVDICVDTNITVCPDWKNLQPPVLFPVTAYSGNALLGLIYTKLSNYEKAYPLLEDKADVLQAVDLLNRLQQGYEIPDTLISENNFVTLHNKAVALHYGTNQQKENQYKKIAAAYNTAIVAAPEKCNISFTEFHLAQLHSDFSNNDKAEAILQNLLLASLSTQASIAVKNVLCNVWMKKLTVPYDEKLKEHLKMGLWECLQYYEANNRTVEAALVLVDASHIATISNSFSEALGYINRAIAIFESEQMEELLAQAHFTKGNLLQTWAQNGNPQFYRTAVQSYQAALRTFTKDTTPDVFAEIQHQLGRVYAEIPDEVKKKGVWAAVSVSSFNEALSFYNKIDYPYEFSMICNSLGNAYTKYPVSINTDNYDKALAWYREALDIRTAENYPVERALTLSNYLEASWFAGNKNEFDEERYKDMITVAEELLTLSKDEAIIKSAKRDIEQLKQLKQELLDTVKN
jgi:tetratricopeptide (TPR) repeat protein